MKNYDRIGRIINEKVFKIFLLANAASEREAGFQLVMLVAAVGLAFAAYASLLDEKNRVRPLFSLISFVMLLVIVFQALAA